jgi:2-isopropylmalate synthase
VTAETGTARHLHLARWSCTSGSKVRSRGVIIIESGDHRWQASAEGNGPVDALFRAVDEALHEVLTGHPRLLAYDVHALSPGTDAEAVVTVSVAPPAAAAGARAEGVYRGRGQDANIIAASIEAYVDALDALLAEEHWQGATDEAGNYRAVPVEPDRQAEYDPAARPDIARWFEG